MFILAFDFLLCFPSVMPTRIATIYRCCKACVLKRVCLMKHAKHAPQVEGVQKIGKHGAVKDPSSSAPVHVEEAEGIEISEEAVKKPRNLKGLKIAGIIVAALVAIVALSYVVGALVFQGRFFPNTTAGGEDLSLMSADEASALFDERASEYALLVEGGDFSARFSASDIGFAFDADAVVADMLASRDAWMWPLLIWGSHDLTDCMSASCDESALERSLGAALESHNAEATLPADATVAYDASVGQFVIVPESAGSLLDDEQVFSAVKEAVASLESKVELGSEHLVQPDVLRDDDRLVQAAALANGMVLVNVDFYMGESLAVTLDADVANAWVAIDESYTTKLDEEALKQWAYDTASKLSTYHSGRTYTRPDGKEITITGGVYGWIVDADAFYNLVKTAVESDQSGTIAVPVTQEAATYDPNGGRDWGNRYVDVDLAEQHARFYNDAGELVWETDIVSGVPGNGSGSITPTGVYTLNANPAPAKLKGTDWDGSEYETPVSYWMPFVGNLIGLHDASWQWAFGGNRYQIGYGSHGCVNLPVDKAYELSQLIVYGDVVVVHW